MNKNPSSNGGSQRMVSPVRRDPGVRPHAWKALRDEPWQVLSVWRAQGGIEGVNLLSCCAAFASSERSHARPDDCYVNAPKRITGDAWVWELHSHSYGPHEFREINTQLCATAATSPVVWGRHYFTIEKPLCERLGWKNFFSVITSDSYEPSRTP